MKIIEVIPFQYQVEIIVRHAIKWYQKENIIFIIILQICIISYVMESVEIH